MEYEMCTKCVMDASDSGISFDECGICNHCREAEINLPKYIFTEEESKINLEKIKNDIRSSKKAEHDSIIGLSGGVDSSYVAYLAWKMGLNPLCVHFDNGWNSEIAVSNIKKIISKTGFELYTYVIDWPEFKDLQRSYFKAGVIDIEALTDHAIMATMFKFTRQFKINYILSGSNYVTEHGMPESWVWPKQDLVNIKSIQKKYGTRKIKSFPMLGSLKYLIARQLGLSGKYVQILNHINYKKLEAMKCLEDNFDWEYYGGKHYESTFTKFYQAYILPHKFKVDKRRVHLSALIRNNEISRSDALDELEKPLYSQAELKKDMDYVVKKLDFTKNEFISLMEEEPRSHAEFKSDEFYISRLVNFRKSVIRKIGV